MTRFKRLGLLLALLTLLAASCSTGSSDDASPDDSSDQTTDGATSAGNSGIPEVIEPLDARDAVHSALEGKRIAFIPILYDGFKLTEQWGSHMERAFTSLGAEFNVYDANFDTDLMIRTIDDLVSKDEVDVLVLHNPDVGVLSKQIEAAQEAGVYTVVVNMISNQSADAFIGADVVSASAAITERAVADCNASGRNKVAVIEGVGPDGFSLQFNAGAQPVLDAAGIEIVSTVQSNWDLSTAAELATTILQQHGDELCALLLPWDIIAVGAGQAVAAAVADGTIEEGVVGVYNLDSSADWCASLRAGEVTASGSYDVPGIGTGAVLAVQSLLEIGDPPGTRRTVTYVPHVVVDIDNVDSISSACYQGS